MLRSGQFLLEILALFQQHFDFSRRLPGLAAQQPGNLVKRALIGVYPLECAFAGYGLDAPHARGNTALRCDLEDANVAGAIDVGATTQLD